MFDKIIKYFPYFSLAGILIIFQPEEYVFFGETAFKILLVIMFLRPLRDAFPQFKILSKFMIYRKHFGIIAGSFGIAHGIGYFLDTNIGVDIIFNPNIWRIDNYMAWGIIAFAVAIPLTITSNKFSMIKMGGKAWKRLQYLAYIMFFSVLLHIALVNDEKIINMMVVAVLYILLYAMAFYKNTLKSKRNKG